MEILDPRRKYKTAEVAELLQMNSGMVNYYARKYGYFHQRWWTSKQISNIARAYRLGPYELWSTSKDKVRAKEETSQVDDLSFVEAKGDELDALLKGISEVDVMGISEGAVNAVIETSKLIQGTPPKTKQPDARSARQLRKDIENFQEGERVYSMGHGPGTVTGVSSRRFVVQFDDKLVKSFNRSGEHRSRIYRIGETYVCTERGLAVAPVPVEKVAVSQQLKPAMAVLVRRCPGAPWDVDIFSRVYGDMAICVGCTVPCSEENIVPFAGNEALLGQLGGVV